MAIEQGTELTQSQKALADALISTKTLAKVGRREVFEGEDDEHPVARFTHPNRLTSPIDFARNGEYVLKIHEKYPLAPLSPFYVNLRNLPPELMSLIALTMGESNFDPMPNFCTGIPEAGTAMAAALSRVIDRPHLAALRKVTSGGERRIIPGGIIEIPDHWRDLLIVDDLITGADTKFEAISAAKSVGFNIAGIAVLFDREQGGVQQLEAKGYKVYAPLRITSTFEYYWKSGQITWDQYRSSMEYLGKPI